MKILITGSQGFIGKNIEIFLKQKNYQILKFDRNDKIKKLYGNILKSDLILHFAGENRPSNPKLFYKNNTELTDQICKFLIKKKLKTKIIFTSTSKISNKSLYAITKKQSEQVLIKYSKITNAKVSILRFPNVFGKWSKPNYNSVVATFAYNISRGKKIKIFNKNEKINLLYIDDAMNQIYRLIKTRRNILYPKITKVSTIKVSNIAKKLINFQSQISEIYISNIRKPIDRNLYSTFISFMPEQKAFSNIKKKIDVRGNFVEFLKSKDYGQVSLFTINKNQERGGHYHNSKVEKFLIIKGYAKLIFKNIASNKYFFRKVTEKNLCIFHSIPGWVHTIKNVGNSEIVGIVWANEIFNEKKADTFYK